jgi:hypothetical protein
MSFWGFLGSIGGGLLGLGAQRSAQKFQGQMSHHDREYAEKTYFRDLRHTLGSKDYYNVGTKGMDQIGRERDIAHSDAMYRQAFDTGREYGLTPTEVAGSPVPGGTAQSGGGATLGNQQAAAAANQQRMMSAASDRQTALQQEMIRSRTQLGVAAIQSGVNLGQLATQRRGQDIQMSQTQLQTATQREVAKISADASIKSSAITGAAMQAAAAISASASRYTADTQRLNVLGQLRLQGAINDAQIAKIAAETGLIMQDTEFKAALHDERWEKLFSSMGAENVVTSSLALKHGLNLESVLKGEVQNVDIQELQAFNDEVLSRLSKVNIESEGVTSIIQDGLQSLGQGVQGVLGR